MRKVDADRKQPPSRQVSLTCNYPTTEALIVRTTLAAAFLLFISLGLGAQENLSAESASAILQKNFASAYNRRDLEAMAAAFDENAIRVTPGGIFQGAMPYGKVFKKP
ncbi:nuclear transport factor 2 family protein [Bradyrhizobium sp. 40]|uniref:hypothetical protein n=1 Tax=Bradyrhizobium sp. 40 TaxID=2782674 RepID=UPI001FFEDBC4|nr:hypothetical protein [Bradyrhizobium sp. 40]UPJ44159.1 nuclear transport factor 2 family protein [Bradyrhizobium sp. 40]